MTTTTKTRKRSGKRKPTYQQRARETVSQWMKARGWTLAAVGKQLDPPRDAVFVSRFFRGKVDADVDTLHQFAAIFGNDYTALFGVSDEKADDPLARIVAAYATMSDENKDLLLKLATTFARSLVAPRRGESDLEKRESSERSA